MRPEGHLLKLLRRPDLPLDVLAEILRDRAARRFHAVRRALAGHPRTPRSDALALLATLFWRDLAHLSADVSVPPPIRLAADRDLVRRLPDMALAERVDLARTVGRGTLVVLRYDPDPRVVEAFLDNRFAVEADVVVAAARPGAAGEILEIVATHPRWSVRTAVRSALLRNPSLPTAIGLTLITRATREDLEALRRSPLAPPLLKACAERVLADRAAGV